VKWRQKVEWRGRQPLYFCTQCYGSYGNKPYNKLVVLLYFFVNKSESIQSDNQPPSYQAIFVYMYSRWCAVVLCVLSAVFLPAFL
jgi:hypothetical protein